jgi:hypothetical protein
MMEGMKLLSWVGPLLAVTALGGVFVQQRRITSLEQRLTALQQGPERGPSEDSVAALSGRLDRLERLAAWRAAAPTASTASAPSAPAAAGAPSAPAGPEIQQLREDVDALLTGEATATEQGKARLRALIAETQQQQWGERMAQRDERILSRLTESARLNPRQREDLGKVLAAEREQRRTLMAAARSGQGSMESLRPALQALREQTDQKARAILDAEQMTQFTATRSRGPRGGGGGNGGGGQRPDSP